MSGQLRFGAACLLLTVTLIGFAAGAPSEADVKVLEMLQKSLAGVKEWDTFKVESGYRDTQNYYQDFLLPVKRVVSEVTSVAVEKTSDGKYKSHTDIKRLDDYQVSMFTSFSSKDFWHYEWVRSEDGFWFNIHRVPKKSAIARQKPSFIGRWTQGDEKLRGGYDDLFTDHVHAGLDSADFLEKEAVESVKELEEATVKGKPATCYEIVPAPLSQDSEVDREAILQSLVETTVQDMPEGFGVVNADKVETPAMEAENAGRTEKYKVCVSKGDDKALMQIGRSFSIGPFTARSGYHILMHLTIAREATRTYSDVNEPVKFPVFKGPTLEVA